MKPQQTRLPLGEKKHICRLWVLQWIIENNCSCASHIFWPYLVRYVIVLINKEFWKRAMTCRQKKTEKSPRGPQEGNKVKLTYQSAPCSFHQTNRTLKMYCDLDLNEAASNTFGEMCISGRLILIIKDRTYF